MLTLHLRINDSATKQPTPVRLCITAPNGESLVPLGRLSPFPCGTGEHVGGHLRIERENWCYIDGACEIPLPAGVPLRVRATKGLEFTPLDETVTLGTGQMALRFEISRVSNWAERGWHSADGRVHFLTPQAAMLEAAAEDVGTVNLLAKVHTILANDGNTYPTLSNILEFSGQTPALAHEGREVVVNTLNTHAALGSLSLLNSHRTVHPLTFGEPFDSDDWSLLDWCNQCHRKKGLVVWVDAFRSEKLLGGEALLAAILSKVDAIEFDSQPRSMPLLPWCYRLWNAGVKLPLVGSSGKDSNRVPLGAMRMYTRGEVSYPNWVESVRSGQTFITNGPLLDWDDSHVTAECSNRFDRLELIADGQVIANSKPTAENGRWVVKIPREQPAGVRWWAARCVGGPCLLNPTAVNFAHSSPMWGDVSTRDPKAVTDLLPSIEALRDWTKNVAAYQQDKWRTQLLASCDAAEEKLRTA